MVIISENKASRYSGYSKTQFRYGMTYVVITFVVLLILNIYCSQTCQELFYESKKTSMVEKCLLASDEIGKLEVLNPTTVAQAVSQMESLKVTRLIVTDTSGSALFDSAGEAAGTYVLFPEILTAMEGRDATDIIVTRMNQQAADYVAQRHQMDYDPMSRLGIVRPTGKITAPGYIAVVSGGTSDMAVCEEAARTAIAMGNKVERLYDVGVAGLHRLLSKLDVLMQARVVIAVAGMEGALASVVGGLVDCPVIAVPTSVGYGANFNGLSALLSMLNSCASGVSVVNIDNGFGAGYLASMINHMGGSDQ